MIIEEIVVSNAGPFLGEWAVSFSEGPTVVVAEYEEGDARSNRAGKSFLAVDAPMYALFGKWRGARVADFSHRLARGKEDAWVELRVRNSLGVEFKIRRGRTAAGDPIRLLDGVRVSESDLRAAVEGEILGLTFEEYQLTNAFVQGDMHAFMKMTAGEKRRTVSPWFRTDRWAPRAALANARLAVRKRELQKLEDAEASLQAELREYSVEEREEELRDAEDRVKEARSDRDAAARALAKLQVAEESRKETYRAARRAQGRAEELREALERDLRAARGDVSAAEMALGRAKEALTEARARAAELEAVRELREGLDALRVQISQLREGAAADAGELMRGKRRRDELRAKYKSLSESRTGICPILRETCDRVALDRGVLEEIRAEGLEVTRRIEEFERRSGDARRALSIAISAAEEREEALEALEALEELPGEAEARRSVERAAERLEERIHALAKLEDAEGSRRAELERAEEDARELQIPNSSEEDLELRTAEDALRQAERELESAYAEKARAAADVSAAEEALGRVAVMAAERAELRAEVSKLAWASYAFGVAGIPSRELENAFGVAEDSMNTVLRDLGTQLRVRFEPTRELKEWEPACLACGERFEKGERRHVCRACGAPRERRRRDELRLEVDDGANESTFDLDSGGGKVLLSIGVRLGLAALPGAFRAVRCEHVIIDEPDGALDAVNRAALHALIRRLHVLGIRQTILITHADVRREFAQSVTVHRWEDEDRSAAWND